jgi:subfamily B ATP-binding cassette protein MsbA
MVIPFLSVLFGQTAVIEIKPEFTFSSESIKHTFDYYIGIILKQYGVSQALFFTALSMVCFSILSNLFRYLALYFLAPIRAGILRNMRKDIYQKLLILPLSYYAKHKKGDIINRFGSDVQEMEWSIISSVQVFCRDPFKMLAFLITLFSINLKLTFITLIILPISGFIITYIGKFIKRYSLRTQETLVKISSKYEEAISGLRIIKGYNAIDLAAERFKDENKHFTKSATKLHRVNELGSPLIEFLSIFFLGIILFIGSIFVLDSSMFNGGIFAFYILIFSQMLSPAKQLVTVYYAIQKGKPSAKRIFDLIDSDEKIKETENAFSLPHLKNKITYKDVCFNYQEKEGVHFDIDVLHHINLTIRKGEKVAFVGHSGSGKSTLADLLPRFYDVTSGELLMDEVNIKDCKLHDVRELIGIVNQDVILFHDTVFNNIAFGKNNISKQRVIEVAKMAQAHDFIMELENGYETIIGDRGTKLSGGQRQRLSIARTILQNPEILIFDEATSALDAEAEYLLQDSIDALLKGRTAVIIAHRLSTIRNVDKILFIEKGNIKEIGTHTELMEKKGEYYKFCTLQMGL